MNARKWLWIGVILLAACTATAPAEKTEVETPFEEVESLAVPTATGGGFVYDGGTAVSV